MSSIPFGEHLKREREMRGVSLEEIAAATRISTRFLEALEKEQWDELPGGVFNRGFIRSVSKYLGLDEDDMVAEYAIETQQASQPQLALPTKSRAAAEWPRKSRVPAVALALFVLGILITAGWYIGSAYGPAIWQRIRHEPVASAAAPATTAPSSIPSLPAPQISGGMSQDASAVPAPSTLDPASAQTLPAIPASPALLELKIQAGKPARVQVFADGQSIFDAVVEIGATKSFQARDNFQVTSSDASAVLLELNGQSMPPIGLPGQPGAVSLSRKDLPPQPAPGGAGGAH
jgi:cytoskeleton protein RodZ